MHFLQLAGAALISATMFAAALPAQAQSEDDTAYIISLLTPKGHGKSFDKYTSDTTSLMKKHGGGYIVAPIKVEKELVNDYLPDAYSEFPSEYVTIAAFDNADALNGYLSSASKHFDSWSGKFETSTRFVAGLAPSPGGGGVGTVISQEALRGGDAFILLNAASFVQSPDTPTNLAKYGSAGSVVVGAGTNFFATFAKVAPVTGEFPFQILFLSEWASEEAFDSVHHNPTWQAVAPYRNKSLTGFTEAKGVVRTSSHD